MGLRGQKERPRYNDISMTRQEIATVMGLTESGVQRIENTAIRKLGKRNIMKLLFLETMIEWERRSNRIGCLTQDEAREEER